MYQEDVGGSSFRTMEEEQVNWGVKLLKIAVISLVVSFSAYVLLSILEIIIGIPNELIEIILVNNNFTYYGFEVLLDAIHDTFLTLAVFFMAIGLWYLSRILPEPVNKKMKTVAIIIFIIIPTILLVTIIIDFTYMGIQSSYTRFIQVSLIFRAIQRIVVYGILAVGALLFGKELQKMSEMQGQKTDGMTTSAIVMIILYSIWVIGTAIYISLPLDFYGTETAKIPRMVAVYMENIGQLLFALGGLETFSLQLYKINKLSTTEIALASIKLY